MKKLIYVLIISLCGLTQLKAQPANLVKAYPDLKILEVITENAPYYKSPNSEIPAGNVEKGKTVFSAKVVKGLEVIVLENGEFLGYMKPEAFKILKASDSITPGMIGANKSSELTENELLARILEVEKKNEENTSTIKTIMTIQIVVSFAAIAAQYLILK